MKKVQFTEQAAFWQKAGENCVKKFTVEIDEG